MIRRLRALLERSRSLFTTQALDAELEEELSAHLEMATEEHVRRGLSQGEARRIARIELGGIGAAKALHREHRALPGVETLLQDIRYGVRSLRRERGFAVCAVLLVGLGVAASTIVFSIANALLVRPLPFADPETLVWIANGTQPDQSARTVQVAYVENMRRNSQFFADVAGYSPFYREGDYHLAVGNQPQRATGMPITCNLLPLLGVEPIVGRNFSEDQCLWNGPPAVLIAHGLWVRRFAGDPGIVGRTVRLGGGRVAAPAAVTVVGVLPPWFDLAALFAPGTRVDFYMPFPLGPESNRNGNTLALIGRLRPGAAPDAAQAETAVLADTLRQSQQLNMFNPRVRPLREQVSGAFRPIVYVLAGSVGLVLLIVCANVSNLLLARSSARAKEMAVRAALGAGRRRLIRQMLTESVVLSSAGAVVGLALAAAGTRLLASLQAPVPLLGNVRLDGLALASALGVTITTGLAFGVMPALRSSAFAIEGALRQKGRGSSDGRGHGRMLGGLVVTQVALACVLLIGATLLVRSFVRLLDVDLGFEPARAIAIRIDPGVRFDTVARRTAYYDDLLHHVRDVPAVQAAGLIDVLPFGFNRLWDVTTREQPATSTRSTAFVRIVSEDYLPAMGVTLVSGRHFTTADREGSAPVAIVNEAFARMLWPGQDAIGHVFTSSDVDREVVGVVRGTRHQALEEQPGAEMYFSFRQMPVYEISQSYVVVRGTSEPAALTGQVREALARAAPQLPTDDVRILETMLQQTLAPRRLVASLLTAFAVFALMLAAFGIYGVIAYATAQRRKEFGIRLALGESPGRLRGRVLARVLALTTAGLMLGLAASLPAGRLLRGLLFEIAPADSVTFATIPLVLLLAAALAGYLPARRACRTDALEVLRDE
jgi:putative ABC transport system permease protein